MAKPSTQLPLTQLRVAFDPANNQLSLASGQSFDLGLPADQRRFLATLQGLALARAERTAQRASESVEDYLARGGTVTQVTPTGQLKLSPEELETRFAAALEDLL